jgi:uncharacterized membrane protein
MLTDSKYPVKSKRIIRPIWSVLAVFLFAIPFLYIVWPGKVITLLEIIAGIIVLSVVYKLIKEIAYRITYVRKSNKEEGRDFESILSDPPLRRT